MKINEYMLQTVEILKTITVSCFLYPGSVVHWNRVYYGIIRNAVIEIAFCPYEVYVYKQQDPH